jgi:hypothetical protein
MRYNVYGLNAISKEPLPPLSVDADNEEAARQRAAQEGMLAQSIEPVESLAAKATTNSSAPSSMSSLGKNETKRIAQALRVAKRDLGCALMALGGAAFGLVGFIVGATLARSGNVAEIGGFAGIVGVIVGMVIGYVLAQAGLATLEWMRQTLITQDQILEKLRKSHTAEPGAGTGDIQS